MGRDAERTLSIRNSERFGLLKQNYMGLNRSLRAREFVRFSERFCILRVRFSEVGLYLTRYPKLCICDNNTALRLSSDNRKSCNFNGGEAMSCRLDSSCAKSLIVAVKFNYQNMNPEVRIPHRK